MITGVIKNFTRVRRTELYTKLCTDTYSIYTDIIPFRTVLSHRIETFYVEYIS